MARGSPQRDTDWFKHWSKPGAFAEHSLRSSTRNLIRLEGFFSCLVSGVYDRRPEYTVIVATETKYHVSNSASAFSPWNAEAFSGSQEIQIVAPVLYFGWKPIKKTKRVEAAEVGPVWERPMVDAYENSVKEPPTGLWKNV
ncbi:hypothetical protein ACJZ2D_002858 [Fusarium nematophilum]